MLKDSFFFVEEVRKINELPSFTVRLNSSHVIFKVHFPETPIVPGVCQIQIISELLEDYLGKRIYLNEVKNIKFLAILDPIQTKRFDIIFQKLIVEEDKLRTTVLLQNVDKQFAKISLIYTYVPV